MITPEALQVTSPYREQPVYLAPFGEKELERVFPLSADLLAFIPLNGQAEYNSSRHMYALEADLPQSKSWGIYPGAITPDCFLGVISLSNVRHDTEGEPKYTHLIQEIGAFVMDGSRRGRGLAGMAGLGVVAHALETGGAHAIQALTAEGNIAAQRSLIKGGFTHIDNYKYADFADKQLSQLWMLADEAAQPSIAAEDNPELAVQLQEGWKQYLDLRQQVTITRV